MSITREFEFISPEIALEILAASNRSPAADGPEIEQAVTNVLEAAPDEAAFVTDIIVVNGYIVDGHDKLSAIANGGKGVSAWVYREDTIRPRDV